jgi:hypothetical protein
MFNPVIWKQQWEAFLSAPYIIVPFIAAAWWIGWWLRGVRSKGKIDGLKGEIAVFKDHLKFTADKVVSANEARDDFIEQFQAYKAEVSANSGYLIPTAMMAKLDAALDKLVAADNAVSSAIGVSARISAGSSMNVSLSNSTLPLRVQAEKDEADKERLQ